MFEDKNDNILLITGGAGFIGSHFVNEIFDQYKNIQIINILKSTHNTVLVFIYLRNILGG